MKTRAAILFKLHQPLVLDDVEIPKLKKGQVLVSILYSGICRAQYNEMIGLKGPDRFLPHLLGHEASGIVIDCGPGVTKVKEGDYVCLSWIKGKGLDGLNAQYRLGSITVNAGAVTTFSDEAIVSENRITKISKKIQPDIASILGCAVLTGCGIMSNTVAAHPGSAVAVYGVGGIGLSVVLGAKQRKVRHIIAIDVVDSKLAFAKKLGATQVINAQKHDVIGWLKEKFPAGIDFAVDASGNRIAMENAFACVKDGGGQCIIAGNLSKDEKISIHPFDLIKGKKLRGTWGGESFPDRDIPLYVKQHLQGELPFNRMITHRLGLEDINQAFEILAKGEAGRIILKTRHGQ